MDICPGKSENDKSPLVFKVSTVLKLCAATFLIHFSIMSISIAIVAGLEGYTARAVFESLFGGILLICKALLLGVCIKLIFIKKKIGFCYILGFILLVGLVKFVFYDTLFTALLNRINLPF